MNGADLKKYFKTTGPAVLPVIHVLDNQQTEINVRISINEGAAGVFLINHDFDVDLFIPIIKHIRQTFPDLWMGINFLAVTGKDAFPVIAELEKEGYKIDAYWADDARIDESLSTADQVEAKEIIQIKHDHSWDGLYFGGTAFKKQRPVTEDKFQLSAKIASQWMDVVLTSGIATGEEAGKEKIEIFKKGCGSTALGIASGVSPDNIETYVEIVDVILVATGINKADDFYNIDPDKLRLLIKKTR